MRTTTMTAAARLARRAGLPRSARRAFSLIEMLVALAITSTLLTAALVALDASFKGYKVTTEGASSHVVTRIVMHRIMTMIRTGTQFAPAPIDPLDITQNPVVDADHIEFVAVEDEAAGTRTEVKIERRAATDAARGPFELYYIQTKFAAGTQISQTSTPMISNLLDAKFTLDYDVGDRLLRATVDLTVSPNDVQDARVGTNLSAPTIRLIASASPRKLEE